MNRETVLDLFRASGALLEGHFRLTSGLHSNGYLQCALVLQHPAHAEKLGAALAEKTRALNIGLVVSPALGGLIIGHEVARGLGVRAIFAERQEGVLTLRRGFTIAPGERVLVVEDVLTTGGSTRETIDVVTNAGGLVVGAASIINRGGDRRSRRAVQRAGRRDVSDLAGGSDSGLARRHPAHEARLASRRQQADVTLPCRNDEGLAAVRRDGDPLRGRHRADSPAAVAAVTLKNVAQAAGITFVLDNSPTPEKHLIESVPGGVAAFDYNGDGRVDLFFTNGAVSPTLEKSSEKYWNRLYRNDGGSGAMLAAACDSPTRRKKPASPARAIRWARPPRTTTTTATPTCSSPAWARVSSIATPAGSSKRSSAAAVSANDARRMGRRRRLVRLRQ